MGKLARGRVTVIITRRTFQIVDKHILVIPKSYTQDKPIYISYQPTYAHYPQVFSNLSTGITHISKLAIPRFKKVTHNHNLDCG